MQQEKCARIHIKDINQLYSEFSDKDYRIINKNFIEHVEENFLQLNVRKDDFSIKFKVDKAPTVDEVAEAKRTFMNYYDKEISENNISLKRMYIRSSILLLVGLIFILTLSFLQSHNVSYILTALMEVSAWVFTWEFIDNFVFKISAERLRKARNIKTKVADFIIIEEVDN